MQQYATETIRVIFVTCAGKTEQRQWKTMHISDLCADQ